MLVGCGPTLCAETQLCDILSQLMLLTHHINMGPRCMYYIIIVCEFHCVVWHIDMGCPHSEFEADLLCD